MTMVIAIVPPVGPPIPVLVGKAIKDNPNSTYEVYLEKDLEKENVFFELDDSTMIFPNGTIIYQNGTKAEGTVHYGAVDSRNQKQMKFLKEVLELNSEEKLDLQKLRMLNQQRKSRQQILRKKSLINRSAKSYFETFVNFEENPEKCLLKLNCLNSMSENCSNLLC